jgi:hypothetical protein
MTVSIVFVKVLQSTQCKCAGLPDPEGTQIFKELLQNADDAKASELVLLLDKRQEINRACASAISILTCASSGVTNSQRC